MPDSDAAVKLGQTLAVITTYGMSNVQNATAACRDGVATPEQQKITYKLLAASAGKL